MVIKQVFNTRTKAWVKVKIIKGKRSKFLDSKQKNPRVPFKGIRKLQGGKK